MTTPESDNPEVLSRLMDGEWDGLDSTRCVAGVCESKEMQDKWARYHLARDVMRGDVVDPSLSIAAGVSAALAKEPAYSNIASLAVGASNSRISGSAAHPTHQTASRRESKTASRWGLGAAGFGIAASAALATVFGMGYFQNLNGMSPQALVASVTSPAPAQLSQELLSRELLGQGAGARVDLVSNRGSYWVSGQDGKRVGRELRLNQLLGDHIEHSAAGDWRGMLPYSRLVGYDANTPSDQ